MREEECVSGGGGGGACGGVAARRAVAQRRSVRVSAALAVTGRRARMGSLGINDLWWGDEVDFGAQFRCTKIESGILLDQPGLVGYQLPMVTHASTFHHTILGHLACLRLEVSYSTPYFCAGCRIGRKYEVRVLIWQPSREGSAARAAQG